MRDHHEFAKLLKITDEPDGHTDEPPSRTEKAELEAFTVRVIDPLAGEQEVTFWARFFASYLPQFIRSSLQFDDSRCHPPISVVGAIPFPEEGWIARALRSIHFNRFVRERPEEAMTFEILTLSRVAYARAHVLEAFLDFAETSRSDPSDELDFGIVMETGHHLCVLRDWSTLWSHLLNYRGPSAYPVPLPQKTAGRMTLMNKLAQIFPLLLKLRNDHRIEHDDVVAIDDFHFAFGIPPDPYWRSVTMDEEQERDDCTRWWACEATVESGGTGAAEPIRQRADCTKNGGGAEAMKACSRCGSVRYCSEAHQLAHWPVLKLVCVRPRW